MIFLSRLDGQQIAVNADLTERLEAKPDTIITLVDGTNRVGAESLQEVVNRVRIFKTLVLVWPSRAWKTRASNSRRWATAVLPWSMRSTVLAQSGTRTRTRLQFKVLAGQQKQRGA